MRILYFFVLSLLIGSGLHAQYIDGSSVKYGNEWIDFDAEYFKITVNVDGIYRITKQELEDMGFPVESIEMSKFSMFNFGEEIDIYTTSDGIMQDDDVIEFHGTRNRNEIDQYMFDNKQHQLNPEFSLITDDNPYYLSYNTGIQKRYTASETQFSSSLPPIEPYYINEKEYLYSTDFTKGSDAAVRYSSPTITEGFSYGLEKTVKIEASLPFIYANGPDPLIELRFGSNNVTHNISVAVDGAQVNNYLFNGYRITDDEFSFNKSLLKESLPIEIKGNTANSDKFSLAYLRIKYASDFKFDGANSARIKFENTPFDRYLELVDFNVNSGVPVFYDINTKRRITSVIDNGVVKIQYPGSLLDNDFIIVTEGSVKSIASAEKIEFNDFSAKEGAYLIISHPSLYEDPSTGNNYVEEYAQYRSSAAGGAYDVQVINIEEVYETFGYGIEGHHLGLRSFLSWAQLNWENLSYVFFIGKGREYASYRTQAQKEADPIFHVPTYGFPGSDNLLVSKWGETSPVVPVGRIAVRTTDQIRIYLKKIKEHELQVNNPQTIEDKLWMKKILHLSGGDPAIQSTIRTMLGNMETELESNIFGADVTTFYKTSSDPIENSQSDEIRELINGGLSILTFFGHSAVGVFDLNLEDVNAYDNKSKYPLLISLGCHSGNIHTGSTGMSEDFVLAEDKGSIAFLAASSQAYIPNQYNVGLDLYNSLGDELFKKTLGNSLQPVLQKYETSLGYAYETLMEQITFHGDPALKMHSSLAEDYTPDFRSVQHFPEIINAFQDSFTICFDVANLGIAHDTTYSIQVQHFSPSNELLVDTSFIAQTPSYIRNYCINIPIMSSNVVGKNSIKVYVDDKEQYDEWPDPSAENNNSFLNSNGGDTYEFFILNNGAEPVEPKNYSIYNKQDVILHASSFNALGEKQTFVFQIDTIESFDSPFMSEGEIPNATGLLSWEPSVTFENNVVYYWRVSPKEDVTGTGRIWNSSSFTYLPNSSSGWSQSHVNQYEDNDFDELRLNDGKLDYVENLRDIRVINRVSQGENFANFFINNGFWGNAYYTFVGPKIAVVVADSLGKFKQNDFPGKYGSEQPANENALAFYFNPKTLESRVSLVNFLEDVVEDGDYVFFYTVHKKNNYTSDFKNLEWESDELVNNGRNIFKTLTDQGAVLIDSLKTNTLTPYNFFYRKNKEGLAEDLAISIEDKADTRTSMFGKWFTGTEKSVKIGPSTKWRNLLWKEDKSSIPENDSTYINIYGIDNDGVETLLREEIYDSEVNLAQISADDYPYLKLEYFSFDNVNLTSPNLILWRVFFDGIPELALDVLDDEVVFKSDTLDQGDEFVLKIPLKNIGSVDVDSVDVKITLTDQDNVSTTIEETLTTLNVGEKDYIEYSVSTNDLNGEYIITIEANTRRSPMECFYFNNFGLRSFIIRNDLRNPLLDVSFDGRRILNGDIVSAEPVIRIITKDENRFLLLDDTSSYQINLIDPDGLSLVIPMDDENIIFTPATSGDNNESEILFTPTLEKDGIYTLQVRAKDKSENLSGNQDYSIDFEIINEELISNVFNYPNPFSDCTQFVFTLTGNEMPQDINIRIMTISGKVVKEISGLELGPLNIGVNRTEYKWDGTDEFGSKLANGVYLYQVTTKKTTGESYEKYDTNTDKFFKNNIGKLVIIR